MHFEKKLLNFGDYDYNYIFFHDKFQKVPKKKNSTNFNRLYDLKSSFLSLPESHLHYLGNGDAIDQMTHNYWNALMTSLEWWLPLGQIILENT